MTVLCLCDFHLRCVVWHIIQFPTTLNKEWMNIPPSALPPVILDIMAKRKKYMKKGNRMILARSVNETMKDWKVGSA